MQGSSSWKRSRRKREGRTKEEEEEEKKGVRRSGEKTKGLKKERTEVFANKFSAKRQGAYTPFELVCKLKKRFCSVRITAK